MNVRHKALNAPDDFPALIANTRMKLTSLNTKFHISHPKLAQYTRYGVIGLVAVGAIGLLEMFIMHYGAAGPVGMFLTQGSITNPLSPYWLEMFITSVLTAAGSFYLKIDNEGKRKAEEIRPLQKTP